MNKHDLSYFKEKLKGLYRELAPYEHLLDSDPGKPIKFTGIPSSLKNIPELAEPSGDTGVEETRDTFLQRLYTHWLYLDEALERIKLGSYGACTRCGDDIARERLEARPYARFCRLCESQESLEA